jgi:hypothetical protein
MKREETDMTLLRGTAALVALAIFATIGIQFASYAIPQIYTLQKQNAYFWGSTDEQLTEVRDRVYKNLCPEWRDQNLFGRYVTYRSRTWCADYLDRL